MRELGSGESSGSRALVSGLGTALPPYRVDQDTVAGNAALVLEHERSRRFLRRLFRQSGVASRPFVIPDALDPSRAVLYGKGDPGISRRMAIFREEAPPLAITAARQAIKEAGVDRSSISDLVVVTSTGACTPGLDVDVAAGLGLSPSVHRSLVSMMGCAGAFHGVRIARRAVESDPRAVALVVCVEICSIHMDREGDPGHIVACSLFGDSAAAVVIESSSGQSSALAFLGAEASHLEPRHSSALTWTLGDRGFELRLGRALPGAIAEELPAFVSDLVPRARGLAGSGGIRWWAVHPGGEAILRSVEGALRLPREALVHSRSILSRFGNLSSAAVLFVLDRVLSETTEGEVGVLLGFGPGLSLEAILARRGGRPHPGRRVD
jgi:predicted naringenin-chalcone synthase